MVCVEMGCMLGMVLCGAWFYLLCYGVCLVLGGSVFYRVCCVLLSGIVVGYCARVVLCYVLFFVFPYGVVWWWWWWR